MNKQTNVPTDYETRVKAMELAIKHSPKSHSETLVKMAERIHDFCTKAGKHEKSKAGVYA